MDSVAFGLAFVLVTAVHSALYALIHGKYVLSFAVPNLAAAGARLDWSLAAGIALALALAVTLWRTYFGHDESEAEQALDHATGIHRFRLGMRACYYSFAHPSPTAAR